MPIITKLNLGCGIHKKEGFFNIDISKNVSPDFIWNLDNGLPGLIVDDSVELIEAFHVLEHVKSLISLMNDCYRVLIPGGLLHIIVPQGDGIAADPTHVRAFSKLSWRYYSKDYDPAGNLCYGIKTNFKILKNEFVPNEDGGILDVLLKKLK